ncbi:MAG: hypothetical protein COU33_03140, partial [Candidatus Magasanikbacteria bacterium CG10_big_fil_rev_8_21_14_0_10_43_6]
MTHNHEHHEKGQVCTDGCCDTHDSKSVANASAYTCPMHPEIMQDKPGMCPECGMQLVPTKNKKVVAKHDGHGKHAGHSTSMFFRKFWISLVLTIPVVLYANVVETIFKWSPPTFPGSDYLPLILGSIVFF